ncbi:MAG TPA: c-type cytochrome domain-containing protein, partial [Pirellulales bacterium]|nr:c-type cytochrome domain-containing protein [Pirellulales bacterium]
MFGLLLAFASAAPALAAKPEEMEFFEKQVRPLLVARCYKCHGPADEAKGGLRLVSRDAVLAGGDSGPAVVEGKPDESLLFEAVKHDGLKMPPDGK